MPEPPSKTKNCRRGNSRLTQDVLPPYFSVSAPEAGRVPRTPQKVMSISSLSTRSTSAAKVSMLRGLRI